MFIFYLVPLLVFFVLYRNKKIDINVLLLLVSTILCTWAAEVSVANGFIRDLGSAQLIKEYESYAMPGLAIVLGVSGAALFIYATVSLLRSKK